MNRSESIKELATALAKAQGEISPAEKGNVNPHFKTRYADLASIWDACRGPLTKYGLSVVQIPRADADSVSVETMLLHDSGEWIGGELSVKVGSIQPQAVGSALTYLRRYSLAAIVGVAPDDDDGEAAQGRGHEHPTSKVVTPRNGKASSYQPPAKSDGPALIPETETSEEAASPYALAKSKIENAPGAVQLDRYRTRIKEHPDLSEDEKETLLALADKRQESVSGAI